MFPECLFTQCCPRSVASVALVLCECCLFYFSVARVLSADGCDGDGGVDGGREKVVMVILVVVVMVVVVILMVVKWL